MRLLRVVLPVIALLASGAGAARSQPVEDGGPTISFETTDLRPGQRVVVTLTGWKSSLVTLSVCGNLSRRGAADCNQIASQAVTLATTGAPTLTELVVSTPPATCPCVIRAASTTQDEVAIVPIELEGVAVGPVVGPALGPLIAVSVDARAGPRGFFAAVRSALGGPTDHLVTVTVSNRSAETLTDISFAGSVGRRRNDDVVSFDIPPPGPLAPGQTWEHEMRVVLPAPMLSRFSWRVTASGAGPAADAELFTRRLPIGFAIVTSLFAADVVAMVCRRVGRRRAARRPADDVRAHGHVAVKNTGFPDPVPHRAFARRSPSLK